MKRLAFACDRRFYRHAEGGTWTVGPRGADTGERYFEYFGQLTVIGRDGGKFSSSASRVDVPGLDFRLLDDPLSLRGITRRGEIRRQVKEIVSSSDGVIVRLPSELGLLAAEIALANRQPLAVEMAGCAWDAMWHHGRAVGKAYAPLFFHRSRRVVSSSRYVSYVTDSFLQRRYPAAADATTVSCSNVRIETVRPPQVRDSKDRIVFGTVGSLHGRFKGFHFAMAAMARQRRLLGNFQYRILGQGDAAPWRKLAHQYGLEDHIHFDGTRSNLSDVLAWLDSLDVYLQPSLREGLPRALIEAMSRSLPAIASSVAAIPELLSRDVLHPAADVGSLSCLLVSSLDPEWRRSHAIENFCRAKKYLAPALEQRRSRFWQSFYKSL